MQTMYDGVNGSPSNKLLNLINSSATSITLDSASNLPTAPNIATIGDSATAEVILYTGISSATLTGVTRGFGGTAAQSWAANTPVYRAFTKYDYDALVANIGDLYTNKADAAHADDHAVGANDSIAATDSATGYISTAAQASITAADKAQARTNIDAAKAVGGVLDAIEAAVVIDAYTENRTIALANIGNDVWMTNASARTITIPPQADVTFVDKSYFFATRGGAGAVSIVAGAGVTLTSAGTRLKIAEQYGTIIVRRTAENVWQIIGSTSA